MIIIRQHAIKNSKNTCTVNFKKLHLENILLKKPNQSVSFTDE